MSQIVAFFIGVLANLSHLLLPISANQMAQIQIPQAVSQTSSAQTAITSSSTAAVSDITTLSNIQNYPNLPISKIESHPAKNAWGTAILFPQSHRYPGSNISDPTNDDAVLVQNQIHDVISHLYNEYNVDFVLAEGDLGGPVPNDKISYLEREITLRQKFASEASDLRKKLLDTNADKSTLAKFFSQVNKIIAYLDRDIALAGAPYQFKAEGNNLVLYGAENQKTRQASTDIVRNYFYLNDRLSQLGTSNNQLSYSQGNALGTASVTDNSNQYAALLAMLSQSSQSQRLDSFFPYLDSKAGDNTEISTALNKVKSSYQQIQSIGQVQNNNVEIASTPSRTDNPFSSINDRTTIQNLINKNNAKMENVVLKQRNTDAVDNFADNLKTLNRNTGIIVFGAEHKAGLIQDLNEKGISVVTISVNGLSSPASS